VIDDSNPDCAAIAIAKLQHPSSSRSQTPR
jgi:hypothetical protein